MKPPKWSLAFLEWFCPDELLEGILGDLLEQLEADALQMSPRRARWAFRWNVIRLFHPSMLLRNHLNLRIVNMGMFKSHLLVAGRNMRKQKFFSAINILGLSCAIAFVFLTFLFIRSERAFDQFHEQKASIFRLSQNVINMETGQSRQKSAVTAVPLARDLAAELPGIRRFSRFGSSSGTVYRADTPYDETMHFVDAGFLQMFDFPLREGTLAEALNEPTDLVISHEIAEKYFAGGPALGQSLEIGLNDTTITATVSGVVDARLQHSSLPFTFLLPIEQYKLLVSEETYQSYNYGLLENYIQLDPQATRATIEPQLSSAIEKYTPPDDVRVEYGLQPLTSIHLENEVTGNALYTSPQKLYFMLVLAVLVIGIAVINFITLSTSQALSRLKEIGVRKTLGALKGQLRRQLIMESFFVCLLSGLAGLGLARALAVPFGQLVDAPLPFTLGFTEVGFLLLLLLGIAGVTGRLQSAIIVRQHAYEALKRQVAFAGRRSWLNDGLIVLQFSISIMLIIGALSIRRQMQFVQHKDLGFDRERLLEISLGNTPDLATGRQLVDRFRELALQHPAIMQVSASMNNAREPWTKLIFDQNDGSKEAIFFNEVNENYLTTMGVELVAGSGFRPEARHDGNAILVNESLVRHFGWEHPLDEQIPGKAFTATHRIVGVVKDFHFSSLHHRIEPLIMALDVNAVASGITGLSTYVWPPNLYQLLVRIGPGELQPVLDQLRTEWQTLAPDKAFAYHFVDDVLEAQYAEELRWGRAMDWASIFAVGIAWLGLLSLMHLSVKKRTREIGIRKVLGSSTRGIISLLSQRFLLLVLLGSGVAWPVSWLLLQKWLQSFSYRIDPNPILFLLVGLGVLLLSLSSIGLQSLRAARANPVQALKFE